jgi:hypothetical protein
MMESATSFEWGSKLATSGRTGFVIGGGTYNE